MFTSRFRILGISTLAAVAAAAAAAAAAAFLPLPSPELVWQEQAVRGSGLYAPLTSTPIPVTGSRDVWAVSVHSPDFSAVPKEMVRERLPRQLDWFFEVSRGQFSFSLERVLDPVLVPSGDCAAQRAAFDAFVDELAPPPGVHVLGFVSAACDWAGLGTFNSARVLISSAHADSPWSMGVVVHELGHNLGLNHALRALCPILAHPGDYLAVEEPWSPSVECEVDEYGDPSTPMGLADRRARPLTFSPWELVQLGWGEGVRRVGPGLVRVPAAAADSGFDAVEFSAVNGDRFTLSYRRAVSGVRADAALGGKSMLVLHWWDVERSTWVALPFRAGEVSARIGDAWVTPDGSTALRVRSLSADALVEIVQSPSGAWVDTWPAWVSSSFQPMHIAGWGAAMSPNLLTLTWDVTDSSGVDKVVVIGPKGRWSFPPGRGMLPFVLDEGETLTVTIKVRDSAGNVTFHEAHWPGS